MARISRLVAGAALTWTLVTATTPAWSLPPVSQWRAVSEQQISQRYTVPITDPSTGVTYQSVVLVRLANLDTRRPDGSGVNAPKSSIYLSLKWSSAPLAHAYGTPLWYVFYANMTPLPASSIVYVASDGTRYTSTRVDPIDPSQIGDATQNDGLLNATYYFTIPRSKRSGSVEILPSRTIGALFGPAGANDNTVLNVGGPTVIPVSFPKGLEYISPSYNTHGQQVPPTWIDWFNPFVQWVILLSVIGFAAFFVRRRRRRTRPTDEAAVSETPVTGTYQFVSPQVTPATVVSEPEPEAVDTRSVSTGVRINVLGHVEFNPPLGRCGDPARAFLVYLALHTERPRSVDDAQTALYPLGANGKDVARATFLNYVSEARKAIGAAHLPEAVDGAYRLVNVTTDWDEFQSLVKRFGESSGEEQIRAGVAAMALVRDQPFTAELTRHFEWTHEERIIAHMQRVISDFAFALSSKQIRANDMAGAEATLRRGLKVAEASTSLWEQLTDVMLEHHDQSLMDEHWRHAESVLSAAVVRSLRARAQG